MSISPELIALCDGLDGITLIERDRFACVVTDWPSPSKRAAAQLEGLGPCGARQADVESGREVNYRPAHGSGGSVATDTW
jgi:hypothetical protein